MLDWSVAPNWDLTLVGFITSGEPDTEYGDYGEAGFARIKFSF
jgi:hypothetical protein